MFRLWWCLERGYTVVAPTLPVFLGTSQIWKEDEHENIWLIHFLEHIQLLSYLMLFS